MTTIIDILRRKSIKQLNSYLKDNKINPNDIVDGEHLLIFCIKINFESGLQILIGNGQILT